MISRKLMFAVLLMFPAMSFASSIKSCEPGFKKCFIEPLDAKVGDLILIHSRMGNKVIAQARVVKIGNTKVEIKVTGRKEGEFLSSGLVAVRSSVDSNDIWTTVTPDN